MVWSVEEFCADQKSLANIREMPASSRQFLLSLGLSAVHPICDSCEFTIRQGPLLQKINATAKEAFITFLVHQGTPHLAFLELWLRLLAGPAASICVTTLTFFQICGIRGFIDKLFLSACAIISVAGSVVVLTDDMYVLEFGVRFAVVLFTASSFISLYTCQRSKLLKSQAVVIGLMLLAAMLTDGFHQFGADTNIQILPGLYYDKTNDLINRTITLWDESKRMYNPCPWMWTGDARTGLPFFLNPELPVKFHRVWLPVDNEILGLDIAFPMTGYDPDKPLYLVLHGLNGGSKEGYVLDLAHRRIFANSTVVVMISRGLMDVPLMSSTDIFRADRVSDAHAAALAIRRVHKSILAGVGYSMGAIVLNNYVARYGTETPLDVAFSISGALECRYEISYQRPKRLWEPMITEYSRDRHLTKWGEQMFEKLGEAGVMQLMRITNVVDLDDYLAVRYYAPKYRDLTDYYSEMGAMGDIPFDLYSNASATIVNTSRIVRVNIPLCILHSMDDPIATWRGNVANQGLLHPANLVKIGKGNIVVLLTSKGGHVGWPVSWHPSRHGWEFMNEAASGFVEAVAQAKKQ